MAGRGTKIPVVVTEVITETRDVKRFVLAPEGRETLPPFAAGAHVEVSPAQGVTRQYSLLGDPADRSCYQLGIRKEAHGRGGSSAMHDLVGPGTRLEIGLPRNNFALSVGTGRHLLLAGGIGVTPLLAMASELARRGADFRLHYFVRSQGELAFRDLLIARGLNGRVEFHFSLNPPVLNEFLADLLAGAAPEDQIYMCGPGPFMELVTEIATETGWTQQQIHFERFTAEPPAAMENAAGFVVRLASDGREIPVAEGQSVIAALRAHGVAIETSCEQGICGTCITRVIEGMVDHHDLYLTDEERDEQNLFAPCVSRALSKYLVLDL